MWYLVPVVLAALDLVSKYYARIILSKTGTIEVVPGILHFIIVENRGVAFGLFGKGDVSPKFIIAFSIIFSLFFFLLLVEEVKRGERLLSLSYSLILGGAFGNLAERIVRGRVTDFIDLHYKTYHWPTFNLADVFITIGIALFFLKPLVGRKKGGE